MSIIGTDVARAGRILREGNVVTFAIMYAMKSRPLEHPSIIHLSDFVQAEEWAQKLAAAFMPGALTLLLSNRENIKWASGDTVALRVPKHPQALQLLAVQEWLQHRR